MAEDTAAAVMLLRSSDGGRVHHPDCRYTTDKSVPWTWANAHVSSAVVGAMHTLGIRRCAYCWWIVCKAFVINDATLNAPSEGATMADQDATSPPDHNLGEVYEDLRSAVSAAGVAMNRLDGDRHRLLREIGRLRDAGGLLYEQLADRLGEDDVGAWPAMKEWREAAALDAPTQTPEETDHA
jgi:hypothetical protein